ncbi:MAG: aminoacyl-histidine dipeptidase [Bacteroidetes bacterium]|nr:aminoacyl-histidine dipeptidase [Bacteroidota bacterium]
MILAHLEPKTLWVNFEKLNAIPRPSKNEEKIRAFIKNFGARLNLETLEDRVGNVIIKKPASPGYENHPVVALQSHLDMVHQKNEGTVFDFDNQGIEMYVDGDFVRARGTTLGADNGIGVAAIMALLESTDLSHPPLEALFTIDEETGMTGAKELDASLIQAKILLNLDTEEDDEVDIGCAGGVDVTAQANYTQESVSGTYSFFKIELSGLRGGHSGMDIHRGFGNANKILGGLLLKFFQDFDARLCAFSGGTLRNAIPREAHAIVALPTADIAAFETWMQAQTKAVKDAFETTEKHLHLSTVQSKVQPAVSIDFQHTFLKVLNEAHNGVYSMDAHFPDLVETSNNLAKVTLGGGKAELACLTRSSVEASKNELAQQLKNTFEAHGFSVTFGNDYPGWQPEADAAILALYTEVYEQFYKEKPKVVACHAGLECGILKKKLPEVQMISFGPNIEGAHSPDECVQIPSVQKFWRLLTALLEKS